MKNAHKKITPQSTTSTKFGQADPKRDCAILLSFIGIGFLLCGTLLKDVGKPTEKSTPRKHRRKGKRAPTKPKTQEQKETGVLVPEGACDLYLAESSLPGVGVGLFSARFYDIGEGFPVPDPSLMFSLADIGYDYEGAVSSGSMIIKPHPVLANVRATDRSPGSYVFTKRITPGNEIFIDLSSYPSALQNIFYNLSAVPRATTYAIADEIVADANDGLIRRKPGYGRGQSTARGTTLLEAGALRVIKSISSRFNKDVAALLPESSRELDKVLKSGSTALAYLTNRTADWLLKNGACYDGVTVGPSVIHGRGVFATRSFDEGDIVVPAPLFLAEYEPGSMISKTHCFGHGAVQVIFCPLSFAGHINSAFEAEAGPENEDTKCSKGPNVFVRWSPWNKQNKAAESVRRAELLKEHRFGLSFDFVAQRRIEKGEEVLLDYGSEWDDTARQISTQGGSSFLHDQPVPLKDKILPDMWRK